MRFHLSTKSKRDLANRVAYNYFFRLLIFKFWFRMVVLGIALLIVFLGALFPKIWTVSPPGFRPVIRISAFDKFQTWLLQRNAARLTNDRHYDRAHYGWLAAILSNPADPRGPRGLLHNFVLSSSMEPESERDALREGTWLLRLTRTNQADLELLTGLLEKRQSTEQIVDLLWPLRGSLNAKEQIAFLKALFEEAEMDQFRTNWIVLNGDHLADPELPLYRAAVLALGSSQFTGEALQRLKAASNGPTRVLANHLIVLVGSNADDLPTCEGAFELLEEAHAAKAADHAAYWRVLAHNGKLESAKLLATEYDASPNSASELAALDEGFEELGLHERALHTFQISAAKFPYSEKLWTRQAALLRKAKDWENMRLMAIQMRTAGESRELMAGYGFFLEGLAELEKNRMPSAQEAFDHVASAWSASAQLGFQTGRSLVELGFPKAGRELLARFEDEFSKEPAYWEAIFRSGLDEKNSDVLLNAAQKDFSLRPDDAGARERYATALLTCRQQPELALKLTQQAYSENSNKPAVQIDHGTALLRNRRLEEASQILSSVNTNSLDARDAAKLNFALFELTFEKQEYQKSRDVLNRTDRRQLFPKQLAWLEESRQKLPPRPKISRSGNDRELPQ